MGEKEMRELLSNEPTIEDLKCCGNCVYYNQSPCIISCNKKWYDVNDDLKEIIKKIERGNDDE